MNTRDMNTDDCLYKVLVNDHSAHGGELSWSLPRERAKGGYDPGQWHRVTGPIEVCLRGLHLTSDPIRWLKPGCVVYAAEGRGPSQARDDKTAFAEARLLAPAPEVIPAWWRDVERFLRDDTPAVPWFRPDGNPDPAWRLFTATTWGAARDAAWIAAWIATRNAARDDARGAAWLAAMNAAWGATWVAAGNAAWDAAWGAARDAAWDAAGGAARDAELYVATEFVCAGLPLDERHRAHARARWNVWQKGYGIAADVDGVLYVYAAQKEVPQ